MQLGAAFTVPQSTDPVVAAALKLQEAEGLRQSKRLQSAKELCEQLIAQFPDYVAALHTLALVLAEMEQYEAAAAYLSRAAMICPKEGRVLTALSSINMKLHRVDAAIANLKQAETCRPDDPNVMVNLAEAFRIKKEYGLAVNYFERFIEREPHVHSAKYALANCYEHLGELEKLAALLEDLIGEGYATWGAVSGLARLPPSLTSLNLLSLLDDLQRSSDAEDDQHRFARAACLHRAGKHDQAWEELVAANEPLKQSMEERWRSGLEWRKTKLELARSSPVVEIRAAPPKDHPISLFILGPSRSGKTTLERLLSVVPGIKRGYENQLVENVVRQTMQVSGCITRSSISYMPSELDPDFTKFYLEALKERAGDVLVFTNTNPSRISDVLRYARTIPGSRFLFIKRDMYDLAIRVYMKKYLDIQAYAYDIVTINEYVNWYYALMDQYMEKIPSISRVIRYEDMARDPTAALAVACELCGLESVPVELPQLGDDRGIAEPYKSHIAAALAR